MVPTNEAHTDRVVVVVRGQQDKMAREPPLATAGLEHLRRLPARWLIMQAAAVVVATIPLRLELVELVAAATARRS